MRRVVNTLITPGGRRIPLEGLKEAKPVLEMIRGDIRSGKTPEQALART